MIRVDASEPLTHEWDAWKQLCHDATQELVDAVRGGNKPKISNLYKRQKEQYYFSNAEPFFGKCAYCEVFLFSNQHGDVEHYRPKSRVTKLDNSEVTYDRHGRRIPHPGYYWLAYSWRNLLPSCIRCNQVSKVDNTTIGKGTRFPLVDDEYAFMPGDEDRERPLLINPTIDNPSEHLFFDTETGTINALSERGRVTCEVLGLNEFDRCRERKRRFDSAFNHFNLWLLSALSRQQVPTASHEELDDIRKGKAEYAMAARAAIDQAKRNGLEALETA